MRENLFLTVHLCRYNLLLLTHPHIALMGFGFCLAFLGLGGLLFQNFQGSFIFFRLTQGFHQSKSQLHIGDGGDGQLLPADGEANLRFGVGQAEALLIRARHKALCSALNGTTLEVGMSNDPKFGVPAHAADSAIFAGDEAFKGNKIISAAAEAMLNADPSRIQIRPKWNPETERFDQHFVMAGDAGFDPLAGQLFSPWNITYLSKVWKEPLKP